LQQFKIEIATGKYIKRGKNQIFKIHNYFRRFKESLNKAGPIYDEIEIKQEVLGKPLNADKDGYDSYATIIFS
jgi:hypothetical protein